MLKCYNRGCGKDFEPNENTDESCLFHPGVPFFHDAYKGWTCCNKKSVDFTEFLNIKGCEEGKHSNVKPPEPVKPEQSEDEIVETPIPVAPVISPSEKISPLKRPDFNSKLTIIQPFVAPALKQSIDGLIHTKSEKTIESNEITVGTVCKNGGCNCSYDPSNVSSDACIYHPGVPIFHEGLKYWSCCTKRTSDFTAFLNQKGCSEGEHKWKKDTSETTAINCRYDWHQSGSQIVIAIYAKMYHYAKSYVKLNPIRLAVSLVFPQQNDAEFNLDLELRGIVDVQKTKVQMLGTKIEITLAKAEPGNWVKLDFTRELQAKDSKASAVDLNEKEHEEEQSDDSDVDLNSVGPMKAVTITEA